MDRTHTHIILNGICEGRFVLCEYRAIADLDYLRAVAGRNVARDQIFRVPQNSSRRLSDVYLNLSNVEILAVNPQCFVCLACARLYLKNLQVVRRVQICLYLQIPRPETCHQRITLGIVKELKPKHEIRTNVHRRRLDLALCHVTTPWHSHRHSNWCAITCVERRV